MDSVWLSNVRTIIIDKKKIVLFLSKKYAALLEEEKMREAAGFYDSDVSEEDENMKEIRATAKKIRDKKKLISVR